MSKELFPCKKRKFQSLSGLSLCCDLQNQFGTGSQTACFNPFQGCRCVVMEFLEKEAAIVRMFQSLSGLSLCCDSS